MIKVNCTASVKDAVGREIRHINQQGNTIVAAVFFMGMLFNCLLIPIVMYQYIMSDNVKYILFMFLLFTVTCFISWQVQCNTSCVNNDSIRVLSDIARSALTFNDMPVDRLMYFTQTREVLCYRDYINGLWIYRVRRSKLNGTCLTCIRLDDCASLPSNIKLGDSLPDYSEEDVVLDIEENCISVRMKEGINFDKIEIV